MVRYRYRLFTRVQESLRTPSGGGERSALARERRHHDGLDRVQTILGLIEDA